MRKQSLKKGSHLLAKSLKEQTKTCPGQAQLKSFLSRGKLEFKFFQALAKENYS